MAMLRTPDLDALTEEDRQALLWLDHAERIERQRIGFGPYLSDAGRVAFDAELSPMGD